MSEHINYDWLLTNMAGGLFTKPKLNLNLVKTKFKLSFD